MGLNSIIHLEPSVIRFVFATMLVSAHFVRAQSHPDRWNVSMQQALNFSRTGEHRKAHCMFVALLSAPEIEHNAELHAFVLSEIAETNLESGTYREALATAEEALAILSRARNTEVGTYAIAQGAAARALWAVGNYAEAKKAAEAAVRLGHRTFGALAPRYGILLTTLANILRDTGDVDQALPLCEEAANIFRTAGESHRIELGTAYQNLAVIYAQGRNPRRAIINADLALAAWRQVLPPANPFVVFALCTKVVAYAKLKDFEGAERIIPEVLSLAEVQLRENPIERMTLLGDAAAVYAAERKFGRAEPLLRDAAALGEKLLPAGHPIVRRILSQYAGVLEKLHRTQDAARVRAQADVLLVLPHLGATGLNVGNRFPAPRVE